MVLDVTGQLFIDGVWTTRAAYSERGGWDVQIGPDVETSYRPNKIGITWANDDLAMDPSNVSSSLYGKIGRNTRVRLRVAGTPLTYAEASSWVPESTIEHQPTAVGAGSPRGASWVTMTAEGLFRRLGKWTDTLQSSMRGYLAAAPSLVGYLPLEDPSGATRLEQVVPGLPAGRWSGSVTLGDDGPLGSNGAARLGTGGTIRMQARETSGSTWSAAFAYKLAAIPPDGTLRPLLTIQDNGPRPWEIVVSDGLIGVRVLDSFGGTIYTSTVSYPGGAPLSWQWCVLRVSRSGGNTVFTLYIYIQNDVGFYLVNGSFADVVGTLRPSSMYAVQNASNTDSLHAHWMLQSTTSPYGTDGLNLFNSYPNETTGRRFVRLMNEQGLTPYVDGVLADMTPMGPQRAGTLLDLITECVNTEGGIVYDEPLDIALTMRSRKVLSSRTPAIALTRTQVSYPFKKTIDDSGIANKVTISNADGSRAVASLDTGPISTQVPPAGIGLVKYDLDVNMADVDNLVNRASYELGKRTVDRPRYQQLKLDLFANPSFTAAVASMRPGDWISVAGFEPQPIMLRAISWQRSGDSVRDEVIFTCLPAEPMQVAVIDRSDAYITSGTTTLNAGYTSTATTLVLSTVIPQDAWSTAGGYDIIIAGESIGVPPGGMSAVSGTGPFLQTITGAVRSKNGVVKAQLAGARVDVYQPTRVGL